MTRPDTPCDDVLSGPREGPLVRGDKLRHESLSETKSSVGISTP